MLSRVQSYLDNTSLYAAVYGHISHEYPVGAGVLQGSFIGPLLWNIYFNDLLQTMPQAYAYADDYTLTFTCTKEKQESTIRKITETLKLINSYVNNGK